MHTVPVGLVLLLLALPSAATAAEPATPDLIDAADRSGRISDDTANLYRSYAIGEPSKLPAEYRSNTPWDGTLTLLKLRREIARMPRGAARERIEDPISAQHLGVECGGFTGTSSIDTTNFHIDYTGPFTGGLTINDFGTSLQTAWNTEVTSFGWAAPPVLTATPPPGNRYHVVVAPLGPGLYGFVTNAGTHAGPVGDNPNTTWNDVDAQASCMTLNSDFDQFPGTAQQALDATTAHEFNHSLQYGYGGASGANTPDDIYFEGGATYMEDEVFDSSNDNYNYLYPEFRDSMGEYDESPYPYWYVFRGLIERYGTGTAGGGEQVMQDFWELTSQNAQSNLNAMNAALSARGTNLADAFHAFAVAAKYNRACGGAYSYPYCFQEGPSYVSAAGMTPLHGNVSSVGGAATAFAEDNYSLAWIGLPASGTYDVQLSGASGGTLRATVVCDTAAGLRLSPLPATVGAGGASSLAAYSPSGCTSAPVAVVTNQLQTAANPPSSAERSFTVSAVPPGTGENNAGDSGNTGNTGGSGSTGNTGTTTPPPDTLAPGLTAPRFSSRRFRAARSGPSFAVRTGTRVSYVSTESGRTTFTVQRALAGRRVGRSCRRPSRSNRNRRRCTRWVKVRGSFSLATRSGTNRFTFRGRMRGRRLALGTYRLVAVTRDGAGNRSRTRRSATFKIVR